MGHLFLTPLKKSNTLNSYWKSFRVTANKDENSCNCLFQFLPLKINLPINNIKANKHILNTKMFAYLFPFGICCFNMIVRLPFMRYREFIELNLNIFRSIIFSGMNFKDSVKYISNLIDNSLFSESGKVTLTPKHSSIFVFPSKNSVLYYTEKLDIGRDHALVVAALMSSLTIEDLSSKSDDEIKKILGNKTKGSRDGEILLFNKNKNTSFLYPSVLWLHALLSAGRGLDAKRKAKCMSDNYRNFINVVLAVNNSSEYLIKNKDIIDKKAKKKLEEIRKCLCDTFLRSILDEHQSYYFKTRFEPISKTLGLSERLNQLDTVSRYG